MLLVTALACTLLAAPPALPSAAAGDSDAPIRRAAASGASAEPAPDADLGRAPEPRANAGELAAPLVTCTPQPGAAPTTTLPIRFWVTPAADETSEALDARLAGSVSEANRLFAPVGLCFEGSVAGQVPERFSTVSTRAQRSAIGAGRHSRGHLDVFLVSRLDDLDAPGEIRGVHWRVRSGAGGGGRYILLSRLAGSRVLAHELGHFFGLPHSAEAASIMNKAPRTEPPPEQRGFVEQEQAVLRADALRKLRRGVVRPRRP